MKAEKGTPKATQHMTQQVTDSTDNSQVRSSRAEHLLMQVGFCVGLGTIWRFPSLCYENGGGTFLLTYVVLLFILGIPLVFMEMALGQNLRFDIWRQIHPRMWGVSLACSLVCFMVIIYYNVVIAWSIFYLSNSFQYPLPWSYCPVWTNASSPDPECTRSTPSIYFWYCKTLEITSSIEDSGGMVPSLTICNLVVWFFIILISMQGTSAKGKIVYFSVIFPYVVLSCFLFRSYLLEGAIYGLRHLVSTQGRSGTRTSLALASSLPLQMSAITSPILWQQAGSQVFYNMGLGFGGILVLSSYANKSSNSAQDAFILAFANLASCLLATLVVFSVLGFRASVSTRECSNRSSSKLWQLIKVGELPLEASPPTNLLKKPVRAYTMWLYHLDSDLKKKVLQHVPDCNLEQEINRNIQGPGLVFVAFTEAITKFPGSPFWSVIFFLMLINLGLSTSLGLMQGILTQLQDAFPCLRNSRSTITVTIGCLGFLFGLLFTQRSGFYFLNLFDDFAAVLPLFVVILCENFAVAWIYGVKRFIRESWDSLGFYVSVMQEGLLQYFTVLWVVILLGSSLVDMLWKYPTYTAWDRSTSTESFVPCPKWAVIFIVLVIAVIILPIPVGMLMCTKKPVILPLPQNSLLQLPVTSSPASSPTPAQKPASSPTPAQKSVSSPTPAQKPASSPTPAQKSVSSPASPKKQALTASSWKRSAFPKAQAAVPEVQ
ncbi:orphan sodium- and chloride-dependent neurotransmitter transporter NTT5 [Dromiciops gliroides]|uniref:orphan sodium- and chloride-dependent neurotransmitter transporter NTT5 n=1 Tax=Dromiciops gliroides TaxID=33562 RepID=UPI001CC5A6A6|nr:orphan sodium- and chloride-dependent neurotransmitter transporter NTT5 [Dromiciops gliroides]